MKYMDEYRDPKQIQSLVSKIKQTATQTWTLMEVCGGQTHAIAKYGIQEMLGQCIELIHGPGCPVCVTPIHILDMAIKLAEQPNICVCAFGDMFRVPGSKGNLLSAKAKGGKIKMVYSPMDALQVAVENPDLEVVFFGVGFETTAPANAMAIYMAEQNQVENFSVLCSHVLVPPALKFILNAPNNHVQGFLAAGHVCTVMGYRNYEAITNEYHVPIVVTGFEPLDILQGILACVLQLENKQFKVENQYTRCVKPVGNIHAQNLIEQVFEVEDTLWRGLGIIPQSGLKMRDRFAKWNAQIKYTLQPLPIITSDCISGEILTGRKKPPQCPAFGKTCTPEHPIGAPMVSTEGACAAYFHYHPQEVLCE